MILNCIYVRKCYAKLLESSINDSSVNIAKILFNSFVVVSSEKKGYQRCLLHLERPDAHCDCQSLLNA